MTRIADAFAAVEDAIHRMPDGALYLPSLTLIRHRVDDAENLAAEWMVEAQGFPRQVALHTVREELDLTAETRCAP